MAVDGARIRAEILRAVDAAHRQYGNTATMQASGILSTVASSLGSLAPDEQKALLVAFYDLFRTGHLSWGANLANATPPFFHVTEQGRRTLEHFSRDPANPDGYMAHLGRRANVKPVTRSYVNEALRAYSADCHRAAAVMIGAASESIALELRDAVVSGVARSGRTPAKDLGAYRIKRVLDALYKEIEMQKTGMTDDLFEQFQAYWPAFTQQIRVARNDAGHPALIDRIVPESVHAALLIFPELADLSTKLLAWVPTHYR
jgi:hypothetical protein